jgi:hypothetical protein
VRPLARPLALLALALLVAAATGKAYRRVVVVYQPDAFGPPEATQFYVGGGWPVPFVVDVERPPGATRPAVREGFVPRNYAADVVAFWLAFLALGWATERMRRGRRRDGAPLSSGAAAPRSRPS